MKSTIFKALHQNDYFIFFLMKIVSGNVLMSFFTLSQLFLLLLYVLLAAMLVSNTARGKHLISVLFQTESFYSLVRIVGSGT